MWKRKLPKALDKNVSLHTHTTIVNNAYSPLKQIAATKKKKERKKTAACEKAKKKV